jgi:TRAP-type uncharacterized transport system substrate-binding protein
VADTAEARAAAERLAPGLYIERVEPKPAYVGINEPTNVLTVQFLLLAGAKASDEVVYQTVKALAANQPALVAGLPDFAELSPVNMARELGVPFHPGAVRFYKEANGGRN